MFRHGGGVSAGPKTKGFHMNSKHGFGMSSTLVGLAAAVGIGFGGYTVLSNSGACSSCDSVTGTTLTENAMVVSEPVVEAAATEEAPPQSCCADEAEAQAITDPDCNQCDADMAKDCPMMDGQCEGDMANCPHATGDCPMQGDKDCPMGSMDNCPMQGAKDDCPMKGTPDCPMQNAKSTEADSTDGNG